MATMPYIHQNGTSADELVQLRSDAYAALDEARESLKKCGPNGRDYYPYGDPSKFDDAIRQHMDRLRRIDSIMKELEEEMEYIQSQEGN